MTSTLAIIINVALDVALLSLLAFVMSHAAKLAPHRAVTPLTLAAPPVHAARLRAVPSGKRGSAQLARALD